MSLLPINKGYRFGSVLLSFESFNHVVGLLFCAGPAFAQNVAGPAKAKATTPEIPFDSVPNFFKLPAGPLHG